MTGLWPRDRSASVKRLAIAACATAFVTGCAPAPTSSPIEGPSSDVRIRWENRTEETYVITLLGSGDVTPVWGEAAPCQTGELRADADDPFTIGIGSWDHDFSQPGRTVADDEAYREADGRLLLIIATGASSDDPTVTLGTWTEQGSSLPESCP